VLGGRVFRPGVVGLFLAAGIVLSAQEPRPTFRSGISAVTVNVVVKDARGRPITNLAPHDFEVFDQGRRVELRDFRAGEEPVSIAVLIDTSGSMGLGTRLTSARNVAEMLIAHFKGADEVALFTFDKTLSEVVPFSADLGPFREGLARVRPYGATSLNDAVAAASRRVTDRPSSRRAVVAITDGFDNSSRLSATEASGVASTSDVPVYVLAIAPSGRPPSGVHGAPADEQSSREVALEPVEGGGVARLDELTARTGGASFAAQTPADTSLAARQILNDLRAGYVLAFTPSETPGWHQLTVRVSRKDAWVRTRAGFWVGVLNRY
jgi:VWFA-related protein